MKIAIIGNGRKSEHEIYTRIPGAIEIAAQHLGINFELAFITTSHLVEPETLLSQVDGIFAAPTPFEDLQGFYNSTRFARENNIPWLGACGASQHAWVEFGINECGIKDGYHIEQQHTSGSVVVDYLPDHYRVSNDGPLSKFPINLEDNYNSLIDYDKNESIESFFANYSLKADYSEQFKEAGLRTTGTFDDNTTPCLFELIDHKYFIGALFQPQMSETPHPIITGLLKASQG